jgi:hypothetical protein
MTWRAAIAAVVALAVLPAYASAGMVSASGGTVTFAAAAGEANSVSVDRLDGALTVNDSGAPPRAGAGCKQFGANAAQCPDSGITSLVIELGDGDDLAGLQIDAAGLDVSIHGGPGNDQLSGPGHVFGDDGRDALNADETVGSVLDGGPGNDQLHGRTMADQLLGGEGDDELAGGDGDLLVGGPGYDELEMFTDNVTVDCEGRDDDVVQAGRVPKLRNCLPAPAIKIRVRPVSIKRFVRTGLPVDVRCDHDCAVGFFLLPGACPTHGTGSTLSHRNPPRTRYGFIKPPGTTAHFVATAGGPASRKAIGHLKGCRPKLQVVALSRDGAGTARTISVRVGKP